MEKLVSRLKNIVSQPRQIPDEIDFTNLTEGPAVAKYKVHSGMLRPISDDPQVIRSLIDSIPHRFYLADPDTVVTEEIEEFSTAGEIKRLHTRISQLAAHNKAVCRRIYQLVLEKQPQYQSELSAVLQLQQENLCALSSCRLVRRNMSIAVQGLTLSRLTVLVNYRRKSRLVRVKSSLSKLKTLQLSVEKLMSLLENEDFCKAIELHAECQAVVDDFRFYNCICKMRMKLKTIRMNIEEALDAALMRTCEQFDENRYATLQTSFNLLGNGASSIDQLQMHYTTFIHSRSLQVILDFLTDQKPFVMADHTSYSDLCQMISQRQMVPCLQRLCSALFEILRCYNMTIHWHQKCVEAIGDHNDLQDQQKTEISESDDSISHWSERYQLDRLLSNKTRVWTEISSRVKILVEQCNLNSTQIEVTDVMKLLNLIKRFTNIGLKVCGSPSLDLENAVRTKFQDFFRSFHLKHLERLKMFLENESWELCPVKRSFSFLDLAEFSSYKRFHELQNGDSIADQSDISITGDDDDIDDSMINNNPFEFDMNMEYQSASTENIMDDVEQEVDEASRLHNVPEEEINSASWSHGPIIANTTLEVCRLIGRYMEIMHLLKPIALEIVNSLCQLYDYYMYSVYYIFMENMLKLHPDIDMMPARRDNHRLSIVLRRIWDRLILHEEDMHMVDKNSGIQQDHIDLPVVMNQSDQTILNQAIVAVESLVYLGEVFLRDSLVGSLSSCLPEAKRGLLKVFSEQNLGCGQLLRRPIFELILRIKYKSDQRLVNLVSVTNWNIKTVATTSSIYVSELHSIIEDFHDVMKRIVHSIPISKEVILNLWQLRMRIIDRCLLEGYSSVVNCSQAGRNLMLIDWQSYVKSVSTMSKFDVKYLLENSDVEKYIKAYYIGASEFETWIRDSYERYPRQYIVNMINLVTKGDRKLQKKWNSYLAEYTPTN